MDIQRLIAVGEEVAADYRRLSIDVVEAVNSHKAVHLGTTEGLEFNLPQPEDRLFARAMMVVKDKYYDIYGERLDNDDAVVPARYMLMPERKFTRLCSEYDYNIFELKNAYPNVSYNMIAQHVADIDKCFVCQWKQGRLEKRFAHHSIPTVTIPYKVLSRIGDAALKADSGSYQEDLSDAVRIHGWRISDTTAQIICFGEDL
jgi:hypothetical protein